jgi:micrococcal nuclease
MKRTFGLVGFGLLYVMYFSVYVADCVHNQRNNGVIPPHYIAGKVENDDSFPPEENPQTDNLPKPSFIAKVVVVHDGDSIRVLYADRQYRVRLQGIDTPELRQAFGPRSKKILADKILNREVTIKWDGERDKYKRVLAQVGLGSRNINLEMVREGWAWHYEKYFPDNNFAKAQEDAKKDRIGLWISADPMPPWDFRRGLIGDDEVEAAGDIAELRKITVYVTDAGKKYHREGCPGLERSMTPIPLGEAVWHYQPCNHCKPAILNENLEPRPKNRDAAESSLSTVK